MKRLLLASLLLLSVSAFGQYTPNIGLYTPPVGSTGWGPAVNQNFMTLDSLLSGNTPLPGLAVTGTTTLGTVNATNLNVSGTTTFATLNLTTVNATAVNTTSLNATGGTTVNNLTILGTCTGCATSVTWASISGKPYPVTSAQTWAYVMNTGQPTALWGTNDDNVMQVWNPLNFNVAFATNAATAANALACSGCPSAGNIQRTRTAATCNTGNTAGATCTSSFSVTGTPYSSSSSWDVVCSGIGQSGAPFIQAAVPSSTTAFTVVISNGQGSQAVVSGYAGLGDPAAPSPTGLPPIINDILNWIENRVLCEHVVNTTLGTGFTAGFQTITPPSMESIYNGAMLIAGGANPEIINVQNVTATTFGALFANDHLGTDPLFGATFPRGQAAEPLFTQAEVLGYVADALEDLLLKTWALYNIIQTVLAANISTYNAPSDAIRIERMSRQDSIDPAPLDRHRLWDVSVSDLDMKDPNWATTVGRPSMYFEDELNVGQFGIYKIPDNAYPLNVWYSQRTPVVLTLMTGLSIPFPLAYIPYYGALAKMFAKDGEMRDPDRQQYCQKRYAMGVEIVIRLLDRCKEDSNAAACFVSCWQC